MRFDNSEEGMNRGRPELHAKLRVDGLLRPTLRAWRALVPRDGCLEAGTSEHDAPIVSSAGPRTICVFLTLTLRVQDFASHASQV
jgi:hypothetical protein